MQVTTLIIACIPILITAATAYLRLFVRNELNEIVKTLRDDMISKDVFETKHEDVDRRLTRLEAKTTKP